MACNRWYLGTWYEIGGSEEDLLDEITSVHYSIRDGVLYITETLFVDGNVTEIRRYRNLEGFSKLTKTPNYAVILTRDKRYHLRIKGDRISILSRLPWIPFCELPNLREIVEELVEDISQIYIKRSSVHFPH